jgi:hypothetical protein
MTPSGEGEVCEDDEDCVCQNNRTLPEDNLDEEIHSDSEVVEQLVVARRRFEEFGMMGNFEEREIFNVEEERSANRQFRSGVIPSPVLAGKSLKGLNLNHDVEKKLISMSIAAASSSALTDLSKSKEGL